MILSGFLSTIESPFYNIGGDLFWELYDNGNTGDQRTLHYPGDNADMQARVQLLSNHAMNMTLHPSIRSAVPCLSIRITTVYKTRGRQATREQPSRSPVQEVPRRLPMPPATIPFPIWQLEPIRLHSLHQWVYDQHD